MTEISAGPLNCVVPDDLTIPQFFLDSHHPLRPVRKAGIPWLIEDATGRHIGLEELRARTFGLANSLKARYNISDNDVVLIFSPNHVDYPPAIWATHRLGAIVSGANPAYTADELLYQIRITKPSLIVTHLESLSTAVSAARAVETLIQEGLTMERCFIEPRLKPGEAKSKIAFLNFSSGTTGKPKAVVIPHYALITNTIQMAVHNKINQNYCAWEDQRFRPGDRVSGMPPLYHIYWPCDFCEFIAVALNANLPQCHIIKLHFVQFCGLTLVVIPKFNFTEFLRSVSRHKITHLMLVPPQIVLLCKHSAAQNYDLTGIRHMLCGGAPLSAELMIQVVKVLPNAQIGQGYGLTESSTCITMFSTDSKLGVPGGVGRIIPGVVAKVVKHDGAVAGYNEPGELIVKTPSLALGYWNNEEATKETFVDGWLHTGDEVIIREDHEVFIVDRLKEIMKVKGFQVAPAELEGCLLDMADVADACVVPVPDDYSGELPMAFVVLHPDVAARVTDKPGEAEKVKAIIMKYVADHKVTYKHLVGGVEFVDAIPKNPSGKLLRRVLRDRARAMRAKTKARL
ncbi:hypothetical protein BU15DRAFT_77152 [Melanogaster broomeanus]|nr:hypothetical protein BU15DRAFT_77152 [Melanogaster broomeanus]